MKKIWKFLQKNSNIFWLCVFPILNAILIAISVKINATYNGGFCVFVPYAIVVQLVCFANMVTFTWMERTRLWQLNALLCGISTGVFFYWVIFSGLWVLLFPVSIWFLLLLLWRNVKHPVRNGSKPWYFAGIAVCVAFAIVSAVLFSAAVKKVKKGEYDTSNPMTERILGMHFRYHTRICIYDGWRPPLHDPAMVIGMRLSGGDPLAGMTLESRLALYHKVYPSSPAKHHCACSKESEDNGYFEDDLWKALDFNPMKVVKEVRYIWDLTNRELETAGLPFAFMDTDTYCNRIIFNLKDGSDTIVSGDNKSCFTAVASVELDGQPMYRLTCQERDTSVFWEIFVLPNGIRFVTDAFDTHNQYAKYWLASESIHCMDSVEIFYPEQNLRDTVKICRIEAQ